MTKIFQVVHFLIDVGNTSVKAALMTDGRLSVMRRDNSLSGSLTELARGHNVSCCVCSAVRPLTASEQSLLDSLPFQVMRLSADLRLPFRIAYSTPETLGPDRIAAAAGAWSRKPGCNLLVIDAGTAVTYDVVTAQGEYIGGNISPGVRLRLQALHEHTGTLPMVSVQGDAPLLGYSTETAIRSGVLHGLNDEIAGCIQRLSSKYENLFVFLTGGDAELFEIPIKNGIFADEFLVLEGLDTICSFNEKN